MTRHLLDITDFTSDELRTILSLAQRPELAQVLTGRGAALIFEKPSNRTRQSMEMAVVQLGGHPIYTRGEEVGFDVRESVEDVVSVMSGYHAVLAARVFSHDIVARMAAASPVPVVNMLSDHSHPLQALADVLTMQQVHGSLDGLRVAYVGDYNNVSRSLGEACVMLGATLALACPVGYHADEAELERLNSLGAGSVTQVHRPADAVVGAIAVHTDSWTSMGQEAEKQQRAVAFEGYTVDGALMAHAGPGAAFYHCLPAYRGLEVSADVIDGPASEVFAQAHNRMHAARGALAFLLGVR
ncbi:MAG TPA: ornithine carbamoyltransferase [Ilumatobacteraceae bacterium]|nr:ornithine carbamoyltransferase [Ilumatobacteraceae bacterium]